MTVSEVVTSEKSVSLDEIFQVIREKILIGDLELEELGFSIDDLGLDVALMESPGIELDSVDVLELVVGIQKYFGVEIKDVTKEILETHFRTIRTLGEFVLANLPETRR